MFDPRFFLATVVSNEDPDSRGRVRIRIMGVHTEITTPADDMLIGIEEKDLPLAQCMYPVTYTGTGGTCPPPSLQPGDWVLGVSLDGPAYQNLMVLGLAKAKFNAEALADGSLNASDAFSSLHTPLTQSEEAKRAERAEEELAKHENASRESRLAAYNQHRGPEYENAAKVASDWKSSGTATFGGFGAGPATTAISTGSAIMNILASIDRSGSSMIKEFRDTSKLDLNTRAASSAAVDIIEEGFYTYCYDYYNSENNKTTVAIPTMAFNLGCGTVDELLEAYGDPRTSSISYAQFYNNMKNDGKELEAAYFKAVVDAVNKNKSDNVELNDPILKKFLNHQYRLFSQIPTKSLRVLGDVVFPSIRSTVTQTQQMLPYYCIEGKVAHEHIGIDIATGEDPIVSFADGTVIAVLTKNAKDCNAVVIQHAAGIKTLYMHMNKIAVKKGNMVKAGQKIGIGGGAGVNGPNTHNVHLHFAIKKETKIIDPLLFFTKDIGFAINTISTAEHYKRGPLETNDSTYTDLYNARTADSIVWSF